VRGAAKLGSTPEEIREMLERTRILGPDREPGRMETRESLAEKSR
jgi:hypothetical protein